MRKRISKTNDFQQAGEKYLSLSKTDQEHLIDSLIADFTPIQKTIQERVIANLTKANPELGKSVAKGLKTLKLNKSTRERLLVKTRPPKNSQVELFPIQCSP